MLPSAEQDDVLTWVNQALIGVEADLLADSASPELPTVFIVGAPRSGSTLLSQLMAGTQAFGYINNFVARFWQGPAFGALLDRALQISSGGCLDFHSRYGTTEGWAGPHEFSYFWRRWFPEGETDQLDIGSVSGADFSALPRELHALEKVWRLPLCFKNLLATLHVELLGRLLPGSIFVLVTREPAFNAQSILAMRQARHGDPNVWRWLKPKEYLWLKDRSPIEQVVGQVYYMRQAALTGFQTLSPERTLEIRYETLCARPRDALVSILARAYPDASQTALENWSSRVPESFGSRNELTVSQEEWMHLEKCCREYFG